MTTGSARLAVPFVFAAAALASPGVAVAQNEPVARPVDPDKTASSRVVVAVQPVGKVPYDGVTLPLTSPDGRFIATQSGRTPSWETLLASRAQTAPVGLNLAVYRLDIPDPAGRARGDRATPKPASLERMEPVEPFPSGLLLGRSADDAGFLVESPRADGSRWIGKSPWARPGSVEWLVRSEQVHAHGVLAPPGSPALLAAARREVDRAAFSLVVHWRDAGRGRSETLQSSPGDSLMFPVFSADGRSVAVISIPADALGDGPIQLVAFEIDASDPGSPRLRPQARLDLGRGGVHGAYQSVAPVQSPAVFPALPDAPTSTDLRLRSTLAAGLTVFSARDGGMTWWSPRDQQVLTLAPGAFAAGMFQHAALAFIAAAPVAEPDGTRPLSGRGGGSAGSLVCQTVRFMGQEDGNLTLGRPVEVLAGPSIPRTTTGLQGLTILLSPPRSGELDRFDVLLMAPAAAAEGQ